MWKLTKIYWKNMWNRLWAIVTCKKEKPFSMGENAENPVNMGGPKKNKKI
tara:strand:+ start:14988 stop:15137 length:150 start_codon:yes stop_codon:yes gene_type:complete